MTSAPPPSGDWTEPGVYPVAPGVHRIPLPLPNDGLRAVNVYAVEDGDGVVLVDSGWAIPVARELLAGALKALDCSFSDVHRFLITHVHRDHYTNAIDIRRDFGTHVALGLGEQPSFAVMNEPNRPPFAPQLVGLRLLGAQALVDEILTAVPGHDGGDRLDWEEPDEWLEPGLLQLGSGRALEVVETPGHTRGHVVFYDDAAGLLFAGDHVLPTITPSIGLEAVISDNPLGDFLGSLAKVRARADARLLPAHGMVTDSVHARVDQLVEHHGRRLDQTEAAVLAGATTGFEVAGELRWTRRETRLEDLDMFNRMLAVGETGAHLDLLVAQGRLTRSLDDGIYHYVV
jgi:glyoxylase-like metal-dependent hydrolase (beta-lactamase superfamily II)